MSNPEPYFLYWGKTRSELEVLWRTSKEDAIISIQHSISLQKLHTIVEKNGWKKLVSTEKLATCHLFPFHSLDVAAVAAVWWEHSKAIRHHFVEALSMPEEQCRAWMLFFVALHDLGKLHVRFQAKAPWVMQALRTYEGSTDLPSATKELFRHGAAGLYLFKRIMQPDDGLSADAVFARYLDDGDAPAVTWHAWIEAVTGHHGDLYSADQVEEVRDAAYYGATAAEKLDQVAQRAWIEACADLFLRPFNLDWQTPPAISPLFRTFLAGFCSVADWLGSRSEDGKFAYCDQAGDLAAYFLSRQEDAGFVLNLAGVTARVNPYRDISALLAGNSPRQVQALIDDLPLKTGLTIIEAPTGSGKTEAALAYAWRLIDAGLADSIVFALPTQATTNAMFDRLHAVAAKIFAVHPNLILAHGRSWLNKAFSDLKHHTLTAQDDEEAWVQCNSWLAQSKKRIFLGQIGVCTIDQVLVSVLAVRHRFVRGFGVGRSVLIVDEVHAYDTYMYKLLEEVIAQQKAAGGSALLLSATLPPQQKQSLLAAWGCAAVIEPDQPYPLLTSCTEQAFACYSVTDEHKPAPRAVTLQVTACPQMYPDEALLQQLITAAEAGAQVGIICNLVDVAQSIAAQLQQMTPCRVTLFHSRFTFKDRQAIETDLIEELGPKGARTSGQIVVATQVVEQSLDIDFDFLVTQLCPVDLLFQRLGRLHRHTWRNRPAGYDTPCCVVLVPAEDSFGNHHFIYGNAVVMWCTLELLRLQQTPLQFPAAYRAWVEAAYSADEYNAPEWIQALQQRFCDSEVVKRSTAQRMLNTTRHPLADTDENVMAVTRDGEMGLSVLPVIVTPAGRQVRDGTVLDEITDENERRECEALNMLNVPASWGRKGGFLSEPREEDGVYVIVMENIDGEMWFWYGKGYQLHYSARIGMKREKSEI